MKSLPASQSSLATCAKRVIAKDKIKMIQQF